MTIHHALRRGSGFPALATFTDSAVDTTNASSYTFASAAIGAAKSSRYIAIVIHWSDNATSNAVNSVTVGGAACSELVSIEDPPDWAEIYITDAAFTSGTTANIVVGCSGTISRCGISVYALYNLNSTTPHATATDTATTSPLSTTINIPAGGVLISGATVRNSDSAPFASWTGATENNDELIESTIKQTSASSQKMASETGRSVQCAYSAAATSAALVAASFS